MYLDPSTAFLPFIQCLSFQILRQRQQLGQLVVGLLQIDSRSLVSRSKPLELEHVPAAQLDARLPKSLVYRRRTIYCGREEAVSAALRFFFFSSCSLGLDDWMWMWKTLDA